MYGLALAQAWCYFHSYPTDGRHTKILVGLCLTFSSSSHNLPGRLASVILHSVILFTELNAVSQCPWRNSGRPRLCLHIPVYHRLG